MTKEICHGCTDPAAHVEPPLGWENHECEKEKHEDGESAEIKVCEGCTGLDDANSHRCRADLASCIDWENCPDYIGEGNCACIECARTVSEKLAAIDRKENEEAWRKQAPKLGIHPDMHVKKSEREALGFYEEDRYV